MAAIDLQKEARAKGKRLKRPIVRVRASALSDTQTILEVIAPDGTKAVIELDTHRNNCGLVISPRPRSDGDGERAPDLTLHVGHTSDCKVMTDRSIDARCDCGGNFVPLRYEWIKTSKPG